MKQDLEQIMFTKMHYIFHLASQYSSCMTKEQYDKLNPVQREQTLLENAVVDKQIDGIETNNTAQKIEKIPITVEKIEKVKRIEEKTRTRDGNYRFKRTDIARCPNCNSFLYLNGENKIVHVRKSFQIEVKCKRCNFFVPPFKDDDKGVRSGFLSN